MSKERKSVGDILSQIDSALGSSPEKKTPQLFKTISRDDVRHLTSSIYIQGSGQEREELTSLKDAAVGLVLGKQDFPGRKELRGKIGALATYYDGLAFSRKQEVKDTVSASFRTLREDTLHHVLSTDPTVVSEELRDQFTNLQERYVVVRKGYQARTKPV